MRYYFLLSATVLVLASISFPSWCVNEANDTESLVSFISLKASLADALSERGLNIETGTFHFVVLMNTVRTSGPRAQAVRDLYNGLLTDFLVSTQDQADMISFSPFELELWGDSVWNRIFDRSAAKSLYALSPKLPQARVGSIGGHDDERAVLSALAKVEKPESAVLLLVSDAEVSEPPISPGKYALLSKQSNFWEEMEKAGFALAKRGRIEGNSVDALGNPVSFAVFYTIYAPRHLRALGNLGNTTRSEILEGWRSSPSHTPPHPGLPTRGINWAAIVAVGMLIVAAFGVGTYVLFLRRPRFVQIGPVTGSVNYGRLLYVGGNQDDQRVIMLAELPERQKVAILEVNSTGKVLLRNYGAFQVSSGSARDTIQLSTTEKTISVKDTQAGKYFRFTGRVVTN